MKTLTRADLIEAVHRKSGLFRNESARLVEEVLDEICDAIVSGQDVKLTSFAVFKVRQKSARTGRNPKTGEEAKILARRVVTFRASNVLKNLIFRTHQRKSRSGAKRTATQHEAEVEWPQPTNS